MTLPDETGGDLKVKWPAIDWKPLTAIGVVLLVMAGLVAVWSLQGWSMKRSFVESLRSGRAAESSYELRGKTWTEEEIATVAVMALPSDTGTQRGIARSLHTRGRNVISGLEYSYQATVQDAQTGVIHVFGYRRRDPQRWQWVTIHPSSMEAHLERRMEQLNALKNR